MSLIQRPLNLPHDLPQALALADISGMNRPHVADWPYRFSSWALDDARNTQGWFGASDHLLGWAIMQTPFWAIDVLLHPQAPFTLYAEMLQWAKRRAVEMLAAGSGRPMWFVAVNVDDIARRAALEEQGFVDVSADPDEPWSKLSLSLEPARDTVPASMPSTELRIRSLDPLREIGRYVELHRHAFQTENMTVAWRARTVQAVGYLNDLDLVAVSAQSQREELVGFCVAWLRQLATGEWVGQIEPMGVREDFRGRRLGRALLTEAIYRLGQHGASKIYIEVDRQNTAAVAAYTSVGFASGQDLLVYRHTVPDAGQTAITLRPLQREEISRIWQIDRSEVIHNIYRLENGQLALHPDYFDAKGWPPGEAEAATPRLLDCFDHGGWCYGAFEGERIVGAAILERRFIGPQRDQLQLKMLHVSHAYRRHGLGKRLFELARAQAKAWGAVQMYISATPSENTVHFYQRRGCILAASPDPDLLALEPEDIHLTCLV